MLLWPLSLLRVAPRLCSVVSGRLLFHPVPYAHLFFPCHDDQYFFLLFLDFNISYLYVYFIGSSYELHDLCSVLFVGQCPKVITAYCCYIPPPSRFVLKFHASTLNECCACVAVMTYICFVFFSYSVYMLETFCYFLPCLFCFTL
jgi:hypothetical protein